MIKPTFFTKRSLRVALYEEIVWNLHILLNPETLRYFGDQRGNLRIAAYEKARAHPRLFDQLADQKAIAGACDCVVRLSEISPADQPEQVRIAAQFLEAVGDKKLDRGLLLRDCNHHKSTSTSKGSMSVQKLIRRRTTRFSPHVATISTSVCRKAFTILGLDFWPKQ